ncbi:MAG: hypothetical protein JXX14_15660 [Deltaproteobacteria bacterium]|nr:hypothetical protein [Deltaproteobacteria bacterium]
MTFHADSQSGSHVFFGGSRKLITTLNLVFVLAFSLGAANAFAGKLKLAVFPVNDTMNLQKQQQEYLYDVIREAASASAGSYIALIHEQKIKSLVKKKKGACDEECALTSAESMGARVALVVEMHQHDTQILGVVKLLDVKEEVLLTVKRFFSNTLQGAEQELQGAVMFVLSAQFLPISDTERAALAAEQQNISMTYSRPSQDVQPQVQQQMAPPPPTQQSPSAEPAPPQQPEYTYSNTDIAQPDEPPSPQAYLVTAIVTGAVGLGLGVGAALAGAQLGKELKRKKNEVNERDALASDYNAVVTGDLTEWQFNQRYENLGLTFENTSAVNEVIDIHNLNIDEIRSKIKLNGILTGVFGGLSLASIAVSVTFTVKYMSAIKSGRQAQGGPRFYASPMISPGMSGAVLGGTF